jgi:hypothetical protein
VPVRPALEAAPGHDRQALGRHWGESDEPRPSKAMCSCLPCLHLLVRARAALESAAVDLEFVAALAEDTARATDALLLADAIDAELAAVEAVIERRIGQ